MTIQFKQIFAWNTNRRYTSDGQRIAVGETVEGDVYFADVDRQIVGKFHSNHIFDNYGTFRDVAMKEYDKGRYTDDSWSEMHTLLECARKVDPMVFE